MRHQAKHFAHIIALISPVSFGSPHVFAPGDPIDAQKMNENFAGLNV